MPRNAAPWFPWRCGYGSLRSCTRRCTHDTAYDYSRSTLQQFQAWVRPLVDADRYQELAAAARDDPHAMADALPEYWDRFRRDNVTYLVRRVYRDVKARRPHLVVSAAVLPDSRSAASWQFQEWSSWLAEGIIDVAVPMAYTGDCYLPAAAATPRRPGMPRCARPCCRSVRLAPCSLNRKKPYFFLISPAQGLTQNGRCNSAPCPTRPDSVS